jgi:4-amino-4-deoxy-L-arabinose transferase-like glycosyltransferase
VPPVTTGRRWLPLVLAVGMLTLGWNLGSNHLLDPDEGRNAEVAREMAATHDYLVPHLDGLPYLDKPIVYFAAAAAAMEVLGPSETAARLPAYLATLVTIVLIVWFARRRWSATAGWVAGLALATMPMVLAYARTTIFDSTLSLFTTAAILAFFTGRPILAWAAIGAGALTKGPIAIAIPLSAMIPYCWLVGGRVRSLFPWRGLVAFGLVALPWFLAVTARIPEFPHYAFVRESFERLTTTSFHRTAPVWYYLPIIPVAAFPWIVPALGRLGGGRLHWAWLARRVNPAARDPVLLACWVLGPLAFFTVNQSKLPQYVLPLMPALALAAARALTVDRPPRQWKVYAAIAGAIAIVLLSLPVWLARSVPLTPAEATAVPPVARVLAAVLVVSGALVAVGARRGRLSLIGLGYASVVIVLPVVTGKLLRAVSADRSAAALAQAVRHSGDVLAVRAYPPSLPFYLQRRLPVATAHGRELTSNFIADYADKYRRVPGTPLLPAEAWRTTLTRCPRPTVFVIRAVDHDVREALGSLPILFDDGRYLAFGPCVPPGGASPSTPGSAGGSGSR